MDDLLVVFALWWPRGKFISSILHSKEDDNVFGIFFLHWIIQWIRSKDKNALNNHYTINLQHSTSRKTICIQSTSTFHENNSPVRKWLFLPSRLTSRGFDCRRAGDSSKVPLQVAQQGLSAVQPQETAHLFNPYVLVNLPYYARRAPMLSWILTPRMNWWSSLIFAVYCVCFFFHLDAWSSQRQLSFSAQIHQFFFCSLPVLGGIPFIYVGWSWWHRLNVTIAAWHVHMQDNLCSDTIT